MTDFDRDEGPGLLASPYLWWGVVVAWSIVAFFGWVLSRAAQ